MLEAVELDIPYLNLKPLQITSTFLVDKLGRAPLTRPQAHRPPSSLPSDLQSQNFYTDQLSS